MHPARHEVVARPLGRREAEHGRLDLQEAPVVEEAPHERDDAVPKHQVLRHPVAAQVQVAVSQPCRLVDVRLLVDGEGGRERRVEDRRAARGHLDGSGVEVRVLGPRLAGHDLAFDLEHVLTAYLRGDLEGFGSVLGVEHDLHQAGRVAQVDEDEAAVVAAAVHPPGERDRLAGVLDPECPRGMGA